MRAQGENIGLFGTSKGMMVFGVALAISSIFLVRPAQQRFTKITIVAAALSIVVIGALLYAGALRAWICYVLIAVIFFGFGIAYPTLLGIFSASVGEDEQGWVMGITTAQFTLAAGLISLIGGDLRGIDIRLPFFVTIAAALVALLMMVLTWRTAAIKRITQK
jgi:DHA1 family tetracycline resistance protein-like MFS transporter